MCFTGTVILIHFHIVCGCFYVTKAELSSCNRDYMATKLKRCSLLPFIGKVADFYAKMCRKASWSGIVWWRWTFIHSVSTRVHCECQTAWVWSQLCHQQAELCDHGQSSLCLSIICKSHISLVSTSEGCSKDDLSLYIKHIKIAIAFHKYTNINL